MRSSHFLSFALLILLCPLVVEAKIFLGEREKGVVSEPTSVDFNQVLPVIEDQLQDIRTGNIEKAYKNYTSEKFRKGTSFDTFKQLVKDFKVLSDNKLFQYQSFYVEEGIAIFEGDLVSTDGQAVSVEYDLVKENGSWKIMGMQLYQSEQAMPPREKYPL